MIKFIKNFNRIIKQPNYVNLKFLSRFSTNNDNDAEENPHIDILDDEVKY